MPANHRGGGRTDCEMRPRILAAENLRYHLEAITLAAGGEPVVMFTRGARRVGGHEAGEHDGTRDGDSSGYTDWSKLSICYARLSDWLAAGNPQPDA